MIVYNNKAIITVISVCLNVSFGSSSVFAKQYALSLKLLLKSCFFKINHFLTPNHYVCQQLLRAGISGHSVYSGISWVWLGWRETYPRTRELDKMQKAPEIPSLGDVMVVNGYVNIFYQNSITVLLFSTYLLRTTNVSFCFHRVNNERKIHWLDRKKFNAKFLLGMVIEK